MATEPLSIYLLKPGVSGEEAIVDSRDPTATPVRVGHVNATLYTECSEPHLPDWASFFRDAIDLTALRLQTSSASAVLVVPMANRTFAVTWGFGRHLIDPLCVEPTFGLRTTLNSVPPESIRSIDKKTFDGISTHTQEQASKDTSIGDFGLDVERDIVRAVCGTPADATLGNKLKGKDALSTTCDVSLDTLPELLQAYLAQSESEVYKKHFPWIDNVLEVRDKARRSQLDAMLIAKLRAGGDDKMWLAVPELIDWSDVGGFTYGGRRSKERFRDVHLRDYLSSHAAAELTVEDLRKHRVYGRRATSGGPIGPWPVYQCIHCEIAGDDGTYLLNGGEWYKIDNNFVASIDRAVSAIPSSDRVALDYTDGEGEARYNIRLAANISGACVDAKNIQYGGGKSRIEFCDVYHPDGLMIHVKRYGASSVLSHLFAQGTVSATAFLSDERFRTEVNKRLPSWATLTSPADRPRASDFEVAFVIASWSARALVLPFFSRVTLRNAYTQLTSYGYRATLTRVGMA